LVSSGSPPGIPEVQVELRLRDDPGDLVFGPEIRDGITRAGRATQGTRHTGPADFDARPPERRADVRAREVLASL